MTDDTYEPVQVAARGWVTGFRRGWKDSGALYRWVEDRGVTGVVHTPAAYDPDDLGAELNSLLEAGARPDASLLWDFVVEDLKDAADALRDTYDETNGANGYVAVWIDAGRANDPDKAVKAAAQIIGDVRRANVAVAMAWIPQRAAVVERLVSQDCPVALSGVRDPAPVAAARNKGMEHRRALLAKQDPPPDEIPETPVFLLGVSESPPGLTPVPLLTDLDLFKEGAANGRVPLSPDAELSGVNVALDRLAQRAKRQPHSETFSPMGFAMAVLSECNELTSDEVLDDIWARDHTLWKDDPAEISDRLGWLDVAEHMQGQLKSINEFARKARSSIDAKHIVLLGMGGSSLAPEMFSSVYGGSVPLTVLDTTHPAHIESVVGGLDLEHAIFVVASKSGTTIETRAQLEYIWSLAPRGDRFVAVTDPGSELASLASSRGFARVFENPPDIGGRYSALSFFGLVPAALCGIELEPLVSSARRAMSQNGPGSSGLVAPATRLAAAVHEAAAKHGRDKLTLVLPEKLRSLGDWIEQLIAESTGKEGTGVVPVVGEVLGGPEMYGDDRLFVVYQLGDEPGPPQLEALEEHPMMRIRMQNERQLGAEIFRWEMATAILGYLLDINPFDQPDVESAKKRAREALEKGDERPSIGDPSAWIDQLAPPQYLAIQAFVAPSDENRAALESARVKLRDKYHVAATVGFGPRFLHSTGQLHKGGPATGAFLQITDEPVSSLEVPGMGFTFARLIDAQADGDLVALRDAGRNVARVSLERLSSLA